MPPTRRPTGYASWPRSGGANERIAGPTCRLFRRSHRHNWIWHWAGQMWYMQRCLLAERALRFLRAVPCSHASGGREAGGSIRCCAPRFEDWDRMSETKNTGEKTLHVASTKTLTLKRSGVEQGVVRQSFSHGRTKQVVVEKVKRRALGGDGKPESAAPAVERTSARGAAAIKQTPAPSIAPAAPQAPAKPSGVVLRTLTDEERNARAHALADARVREAEERKIAEEDAR